MSWRMAKHRYSLVGTRCMDCGQPHFPPRSVCRKCDSEKMEKFRFSGRGEILSYTIIHTAPDGFEHEAPYVVALVQLEEGPVISTHVTGNKENVAIGKLVRMVFRKLHEDGESGAISYGFKFELTE